MKRFILTESEKNEIKRMYGLITEALASPGNYRGDEKTNYVACLNHHYDIEKITVDGKQIDVVKTDSQEDQEIKTKDGRLLTDLRFDTNSGTYYNTKNNNSKGSYYCSRYGEIIIDGEPVIDPKLTQQTVKDWDKIVDVYYNQCKENAHYYGNGYRQIYNCKAVSEKGWVSFANHGDYGSDYSGGKWGWDGSKIIFNQDNAQDDTQMTDDNNNTVKAQKMIVNTVKSGLNLREKPSLNSNVIDTVPKGSFVYGVPSNTQGWTKVYLNNGQEGYSYSKYLKPSS